MINNTEDIDRFIIVSLYDYLEAIAPNTYMRSDIKRHNTNVVADCIKHMDTVNPCIGIIKAILINLIPH